jgi:hypothetical protein
MPAHGNPICGDIVLVKRSGPDVFAVDDPERIKMQLMKRFDFLEVEQ